MIYWIKLRAIRSYSGDNINKNLDYPTEFTNQSNNFSKDELKALNKRILM